MRTPHILFAMFSVLITCSHPIFRELSRYVRLMTDALFLPHQLTQQYTYTYAASTTIRYSQQITIMLISSPAQSRTCRYMLGMSSGKQNTARARSFRVTGHHLFVVKQIGATERCVRVPACDVLIKQDHFMSLGSVS